MRPSQLPQAPQPSMRCRPGASVACGAAPGGVSGAATAPRGRAVGRGLQAAAAQACHVAGRGAATVAAAAATTGPAPRRALLRGPPPPAPLRSGAHAAQQLRRRTACGVLSGASSGPQTPFPFHEDKYHRMQFVGEPYGPMKIYQDASSHFTGVMVFKRAQDLHADQRMKILEMFVAGDTAVSIYTLVNGQRLDRPMVHDVMLSILQRAAQGDRQWSLLRVAVIGLRDDVFVGRLFFGDPETGVVAWDCDCRPSDGCFLSIKCNVPLYIHHDVWDIASKHVKDSTVYRLLLEATARDQAAAAEAGKKPQPQQGVPQLPPPHKDGVPPTTDAPRPAMAPSSSTPYDFAQLVQDDHEAIKLLKRKLAVAIAEEDYSAAAKLRDHPYMLLYRRLSEARLQGREKDAKKAERQLRYAIESGTMPTATEADAAMERSRRV